MSNSIQLLQALTSLQTATTDAVNLVTNSLAGDESISTDDVTVSLESVIHSIEELGLILEDETEPDTDITDWLRETLSIRIHTAGTPGFRIIPGGRDST